MRRGIDLNRLRQSQRGGRGGSSGRGRSSNSAQALGIVPASSNRITYEEQSAGTPASVFTNINVPNIWITQLMLQDIAPTIVELTELFNELPRGLRDRQSAAFSVNLFSVMALYLQLREATPAEIDIWFSDEELRKWFRAFYPQSTISRQGQSRRYLIEKVHEYIQQRTLSTNQERQLAINYEALARRELNLQGLNAGRDEISQGLTLARGILGDDLAPVPPGFGLIPAPDDFGNDLNPALGQLDALGRIVTIYGLLAISPVDEIGVDNDAIPVFNIAGDLECRFTPGLEADLTDVCRVVLDEAYQYVTIQNNLPMNATEDYVQIRVLQNGIEGLLYDIVTPMRLLDQVMGDFEAVLDLLQQSGGLVIDPDGLDLQFRFTFVLATPTAVLNGPRVAAIEQFSRTMASSGGEVRPNAQQRFNAARSEARFIVRSQMGEGNEGRRGVQFRKEVNKVQYRLEYERLNGIPFDQRKRKQRISVETPVEKKRKTRTPEQIQKYNMNRNAKRQKARETSVASASLNPTFGIYDDLKRRIFHHCSLDEFFQHSKAVIDVPNSIDEGFCIAMALIKSEMRIYKTQEIEIIESKPALNVENVAEYVTVPILEKYKQRLQGKEKTFIKDNQLVLFNPFKPLNNKNARGTLEYATTLGPEDIQCWYVSAQNLHEVVVENSAADAIINPNDESCLQFYANVLGVHICVYRLELQGRRTNVYKPALLSTDIRNLQEIRVVSILINGNHAISISSLREFIRSGTTANRSNLYNYCVLCERQATANNETVEEAKAHFRKCAKAKRGRLLCQAVDKLYEGTLSNTTPKQFTQRSKSTNWECRTCQGVVEGGLTNQMEHVCYMKLPVEMKMGKSEEIYVYDLECAQIREDDLKVFIHEVNLVCVRRAYPDENGDCDRHYFANIEDFMVYVLSFTADSRVYLAHNGGKYDVQFVLKYLESNLIQHNFIPTPSSMHAYLSVIIPFGAGISSTFLDFRHFMPGSLKGIGLSFGLSVSKGDFPHHFNNGFNDNYIGPLPELDNSDDYWCLNSKKTQEDIDEFNEWYERESLIYCTCDGDLCECSKEKWVFKDQLLKYCWLDVDVLAEACVKYRNNALEFGMSSEEADNEGWISRGIDPFQYVTIPQIAVNLLLGGTQAQDILTVTPPKRRTERVKLAIPWLENMSAMYSKKIHHIGNSNKEYYCFKTERFLDGFCKEDGSVFVCLSCNFHACRQCHLEEIETGLDHIRGATYSMVEKDTEVFVSTLLRFYGTTNTTIVWEHELSEMHFSLYDIELGNIMKDRDMFYGGRTEVFSPFAQTSINGSTDEIKYHDVCSLYPYVCAFKALPVGDPTHLIGGSIDKSRLYSTHANPYFGYVRCRVRPNNKDIIGLLPFRDLDTGRLDFPLFEMTGAWGTQELQLAFENGYECLEVYEVYHWSHDQRSDTLLRGYVSFFLRMKQEAEGWKKLGATSDSPSEEEQQIIQEKVFVESGQIARIRPCNVVKNPVKRQMAKLFLNSLWGKFCQKPHRECYVVIHGYKQFASLWFDPSLDRSLFSFRHISGNTWKVKFSTNETFTKPNLKYNIFLSSKVTEWARCILHRQMLKIGKERILYCDTDSLMFLWPRDGVKLDGVGLGNWIDEYPDKVITKLYAIAPKFYYLQFEGGSNLLKSKGIQLTLRNAREISSAALEDQLLHKFRPSFDADGNQLPFSRFIYMTNMVMGINSTNSNYEYGTMMTRYTEDKKVSPVFSKRQLIQISKLFTDDNLDRVQRIFTVPKGYYLCTEELSLVFYEYLL